MNTCRKIVFRDMGSISLVVMMLWASGFRAGVIDFWAINDVMVAHCDDPKFCS